MATALYSGVATGGGGFNPFSAGTKHYGGGRSAPNIGPVDPTGYRERDAQAVAKKNAIMSYLRAAQTGQYASSGYLAGGIYGSR